MPRTEMAIVHKLSGEIVAVSPTTATAEGRDIYGISIGGDDEAVIVTEVDEADLATLAEKKIVVGQELRSREDPAGA